MQVARNQTGPVTQVSNPSCSLFSQPLDDSALNSRCYEELLKAVVCVGGGILTVIVSESFFSLLYPVLFLDETRPVLHVIKWYQTFGGCQYPTGQVFLYFLFSR